MERKLTALAIILGVAFGIGVPALIGTLSPTFMNSAIKAPEAVPAPVKGFTVAEEKGPQPYQYILAIALSAITALLAFLALDIFLKKG